MRSYPTNSPQAAARIVALTVVADGHAARAELDALRDAGIETELGLTHEAFSGVLHGLCEDLLMRAETCWGSACTVDADTLAALLREVTDPALRLKVLRLCTEVIDADRHWADAESVVLEALLSHWQLDPPLRLPPSPVPPARSLIEAATL